MTPIGSQKIKATILKHEKIIQKVHDQDFFISSKIKVTHIEGKGLGVIAIKDIKPGEIIECSPVIILDAKKTLDGHWQRFYKTMLETLYNEHHYWWTVRHGALVLGYGSLYNHSTDANIDTIKLIKERKIAFISNCPIKKNTELTRAYRTVWFKSNESKIKKLLKSE